MEKKAIDRKDAEELGFHAGRDAAEAVTEDNPSLKDDVDAWIAQAVESEAQNRVFVPEEEAGAMYGDSEEMEVTGIQQEYENGVSRGIDSVVHQSEFAVE